MSGSTILPSMAKQPNLEAMLPTPPVEIIHNFDATVSPIRTDAPAKEGSITYQSPARPLIFARQSPPSPQSPAVSTNDLVGRFREWHPESQNGPTNRDPVLYPDQRVSTELRPLFGPELKVTTPSQPPSEQSNRSAVSVSSPASTISELQTSDTSIFDTKQIEEERVKEAVIDDHLRHLQDRNTSFDYRNPIVFKSKATKWSRSREFIPPTKEQYKLMLDITMRSRVMELYNSDPQGYVRKLREEDQEIVDAMRRLPALKPKKSNTQISRAVADPSARVRKPAKKQIDRSATPETKHKRASSRKVKVDINYSDIPDYAPPMSLIPANKPLRVTWSGTPLDLSGDSLRDQLTPAELQLARTLRFSCNQYLTTKRRVFVGRINKLITDPKNKHFGKTDAQQVGGVDVNKLSQLWEAYNSVGLFEASLFEEHVDKVKDADMAFDPKNLVWADRAVLLRQKQDHTHHT